MSLKIRIWMVSQGLLLLTATLIQLTFYGEIKVGPFLGMEKRDYWEIILDKEPQIPSFVLEKKLPAKFYDGRLRLTEDQIRTANLGAYKQAARQEDGLRMALLGGCIVNVLYFFAFHLLVPYFTNILSKAKKNSR